MTATLKLYKETIDGVGTHPVPFPGSEENHAWLADYKYSASRMSSAPTITATLKWHSCLDNEWSTKVFVSYNDERYFVKNTPSSSYDNNSCMYSHSLELVSERAILDSVYFLNEVPSTTDSLSGGTEFSFSGDINEFVTRINLTLKKYGYSAVVDKGILSEAKLFEVSNQYITDALKAAYELYEVPYYFVGKTVHFGNQQTIIRTPLEYGSTKSLMSVSKSNSNKQVVNRITGVGSERNIPYYYPNPTPKGYIKLGGNSKDKYTITNALTFCNGIDLDRPFGCYSGVCDILNVGKLTPVYKTYRSGNSIELAKSSEYTLYRIKIEFSAKNAGTTATNIVPIQIKPRGSAVGSLIDEYYINGVIAFGNGYEDIVTVESGLLKTLNSTIAYSQFPKFTLTVTISAPVVRDSDSAIIYITPSTNNWVEETDIEVETEIADKFSLPVEIAVSRVRPGYIFIKNIFSHLGKPGISLQSYFISGEVLYDDEPVSVVSIGDDAEISCGLLQSGEYTVSCIYKLPWPLTPETVTANSTPVLEGKWFYLDGTRIPSLDKVGISVIGGYDVTLGDELIQQLDHRIDVQKTLMPAEYRRTLGANRWYNATNAEDRGEWYGETVFNNEYDRRHPVEYIHTEDDIYPTITGITNSANLTIDVFSEIAFDLNDNDERYPVGDALEGKYKHPYFFAKLRKTDGEHAFNLFEHTIEGQQMTISFTTGHVASCEFAIGMDEATGTFNPVQVDENGELVRDANGDVLCGQGYQGAQPKQPQQQDTINNEVWIALKKEESTMGVIMPSAVNNIIPYSALDEEISGKAADKFVILGIHLPETYITAAEDRLEKAVIDYMAENNKEKFTFSLKLSSIFLAENPDFNNLLNENSKVTVRYSGNEYILFVESYSATVKAGSPLPEVSITLNDKIKLAKTLIKEILVKSERNNEKLKKIESDNKELTIQVLGVTNSNTQSLAKIEEIEILLNSVDLCTLSERVDNNTLELQKHEETLSDIPLLKDIATEAKETAQSNTKDISDIKSNYLRKDDTADFATDLTGVPEATHEEFTYRPSAGRKSIRDKSAVIRRIKGNSLVWSQLATFKDSWTENGLTCVREGNTIHLYGTVTEAFNYDICQLTTYLSQGLKRDGRKYLISLNAPDGVAYGINGYTIKDTKPHFWSDVADSVWYGYISIKIPVGTTIDYVFSDPQIIDLTRMFDAGNEPTTVEEFYARIPEGVDLTAYNAGELIPMNANAIETNGFNQWDEQWVKGYINVNNGNLEANDVRIASVNFCSCLPNTDYYFKSQGRINVLFYDDFRNYIGYLPLSKNGKGTTPKKARFFKINTYEEYGTTYKNDICINLSHSGVRDGEYEPYWKSINDLSVIKKYFNDGMRSTGSEYDEIMFDESREKWIAIRRIDSVDLGNSDIKYDSTRSAFYLRLYNSKTLGKGICPKFTLNNLSAVNLSDGEMSFHNTYYDHSVIFKATSYTDVASFKSAMSGVKLYYELVEPIYTPIDEPLQLAYKVDDFGTEKMLSDAPSAPFRADIVYQFNAEGRIRDNSRNIERLEGQIQTLYQGEDITGSIANTIKRNTISFDKLTDVPNADGLIKGRDTKAYIDAAIKNATPFVVDPDENVIFPEKVVARSFEDRDGNAVMLAKDIPTEVATAVPREVIGNEQPARILPNRLYDWTGQTLLNLILPPLASGDNTYYNKWMVLLTVNTSNDLTIPFEVLWKNGVAPTWDTWCICKMIFFKAAGGNITCGEWEIYSYGD